MRIVCTMYLCSINPTWYRTAFTVLMNCIVFYLMCHLWFMVCAEVDVCCLDTFFCAPTFRRIWNIQLVRDYEQIQIVPVAVCLVIFGALKEISFIIKVKPVMHIKWAHSSPDYVEYCVPRMVIIFWICSPIPLQHMSSWCPFLDPHLINKNSYVSVQIIAKLDLSMSNLVVRTVEWPLKND